MRELKWAVRPVAASEAQRHANSRRAEARAERGEELFKVVERQGSGGQPVLRRSARGGLGAGAAGQCFQRVEGSLHRQVE